MSSRQQNKMIQQGFSLVEIMVVIAIIAILAAVAIPMYGNYSIRAKIGSEIEKLGSTKANAAEYISNNNGSIDYAVDDLGTLPSGASIGDNGALVLDTSSIVADSSISLTPTVGSGSITWSCSGTGLTSSQLPSECQESSSESSSPQFNVMDTFANYPCPDDTVCYGIGTNTAIADGSAMFQIATYEGANTGEELTAEDGMVAMVDGLVLFGNPMQWDAFLSSANDIENSSLSSEQKQKVYDAIETAKEVAAATGTGFCASNPTSWNCQ